MANEVTLNPMQELRQTLERRKKDFEDVLPPQIPVERFIRTTITAIQLNPDLIAAERTSLLASTMKAAQDGLLCDGREAALVIYNSKVGDAWVKKAQYMPMAEGLLKKVRQSGQLSNISVQVVKENDFFDYELGDNERMVHKPALRNRGATIGAYSIAKLASGETSREYMDIDQIQAVKKRSKTAASGPWVTDEDEMCRKTVFRRHYKRLPKSTDLEQIIEHDNENYELKDVTPEPEVESPKPVSKLDSFAPPTTTKEEEIPAYVLANEPPAPVGEKQAVVDTPSVVVATAPSPATVELKKFRDGKPKWEYWVSEAIDALNKCDDVGAWLKMHDKQLEALKVVNEEWYKQVNAVAIERMG